MKARQQASNDKKKNSKNKEKPNDSPCHWALLKLVFLNITDWRHFFNKILVYDVKRDRAIFSSLTVPLLNVNLQRVAIDNMCLSAKMLLGASEIYSLSNGEQG